MTSILERTYGAPAPSASNLPPDPVPELPPVLETDDVNVVAHNLNSAVEALADIADQRDLPEYDGLRLIGDLDKKHFWVGHEVNTTKDGELVTISRLQVVDPLGSVGFDYLGSEVTTGDSSVVEVRVHTEDNYGRKQAEFPKVSPQASEVTASELSVSLAKKCVEVAKAQCQEGKLTGEELLDVTSSLVAPEINHDQSSKWLGNAAIHVTRFLSKIGFYPTAA